MKIKIHLTAMLLLLVFTNVAYALGGWYTVEGLFHETMAEDTLFTGKFSMDTNGKVSNLSGSMNSAMIYGPASPNLYLANNPISSVNGDIVTSTIFLINSSQVFIDGSYTPTYPWNSGTPNNLETFGNFNAFFTFSFNYKTLAPVMINMESDPWYGTPPFNTGPDMIYGDCTVDGLMGKYGMGGDRWGGGMGGYPQSLSISSAVPEPSTYALFALGFGGFVLLRRKSKYLK